MLEELHRVPPIHENIGVVVSTLTGVKSLNTQPFKEKAGSIEAYVNSCLEAVACDEAHLRVLGKV